MDFSFIVTAPTEILLFLTLPWVIFALISILCDVGVGYIDEHLLGKLDQNRRKPVDAPKQLLLISGLFGLVVSAIAFVVTVLTPLTLNLSFTSFMYAFSAGVLEVLWLIPYFYALHRAGALNATPLFQSIPIFSLLFGLLFFSEIPNGLDIVAAGFILTGGFLLNYSPELKRLDGRTVFLMLVSSSIISLGYFLFKDASNASNFITAVFGNGLGMGALSICIWVIWGPYRKQFINEIRSLNKKIIYIQAGNESLYAFSSLMNQLAIILGPTVMLVSSLGALHPFFTLILGGILVKLGFINYRNTGQAWTVKLIAIATITVGAFLIV